MGKSIFYCHHLVAPRDILDEFASTFEKLRNGEFKAAGFHKLRGYEDIYAVETSRGGRLLFALLQGQLFYLENLPNHNYEDSYVLNNPHFLKHFKSKVNETFDLKNTPFVALEDLSPALKRAFGDVDEEISCQAISLFKEKFLCLSTRQLEILEGSRKSVYDSQSFSSASYESSVSYAQRQAASQSSLYTGQPGSGKSFMAELFMLKTVNSASSDSQIEIVYLTLSDPLARKMRGFWQALPVAKSCPVFFLSYLDWLYEEVPNLKEKELISYPEFTLWFKLYLEKWQNQSKQQEKIKAQEKSKRKGKEKEEETPFVLTPALQNSNTVYQELRIASAFTEENYLALGKKQSLIKNKKQRIWLYTCLKAYLRHLRDEEYLDLSFYRPDLNSLSGKKRFVIDEMQDFSQGIQAFFVDYGAHFALPTLFFMGPLQNLFDAMPSLSFLKDYFYQKHKVVLKHEKLPYSYRIFLAAYPLLNQCIQSNLCLTGGLFDKEEPYSLNAEFGEGTRAGRVDWLENIKEHETLFTAARDNPEFVVITRPEFKEKAKKIFGETQIILDVSEAKGLEYQVVVLFGLLSGNSAEAVSRLLKDKNAPGFWRETTIRHRAKSGESYPEYAPFFNEFFTALTRASHQIIIIEESYGATEALHARLRKVIPSLESFEIELDIAEENLNDRWYAEMLRQLNEGNQKVAEMIWVHHLHRDLNDFASNMLKKEDNPVPHISISSSSRPSHSSSSSSASMIRKKLPPSAPLKEEVRSTLDGPILVRDDITSSCSVSLLIDEKEANPYDIFTFDLNKLREFNGALVYGERPNESKSPIYREGEHCNTIEKEFFHNLLQLKDAYEAYYYAETSILPYLRNHGIVALDKERLLRWLRALHERIGKQLTQDANKICKKEFSISEGLYREQCSYTALIPIQNIEVLLTYIKQGKSKQQIKQKCREFIRKGGIKNTKVTEMEVKEFAFLVWEKMYIIFNLPEDKGNGNVSLLSSLMRFLSGVYGEQLPEESKRIIDKIIRIYPFWKSIPDAMTLYAESFIANLEIFKQNPNEKALADFFSEQFKAFMLIHPFALGNTRTILCLLNIFLVFAGKPSISLYPFGQNIDNDAPLRKIIMDLDSKANDNLSKHIENCLNEEKEKPFFNKHMLLSWRLRAKSAGILNELKLKYSINIEEFFSGLIKEYTLTENLKKKAYKKTAICEEELVQCEWFFSKISKRREACLMSERARSAENPLAQKGRFFTPEQQHSEASMKEPCLLIDKEELLKKLKYLTKTESLWKKSGSKEGVAACYWIELSSAKDKKRIKEIKSYLSELEVLGEGRVIDKVTQGTVQETQNPIIMCKGLREERLMNVELQSIQTEAAIYSECP